MLSCNLKRPTADSSTEEGIKLRGKGTPTPLKGKMKAVLFSSAHKSPTRTDCWNIQDAFSEF